MNTIKSLVALIALSLIAMPFGRAQQTETPTANPSPTPAEEAETEKSHAEKSPTPEEKPTAKSEKAETSPSAKASADVASSEKPAGKGSVDAQLKEMENQWAAAIAKHDTGAIEPFIAEDYVLTNAKGKVLNRAGALKDIRKDTDTYDKVTNSKMSVHMINRDAAVVTGMSREVGKDKTGKPLDRTYRWTDTFVTRNGKWQCVATHVTLLEQK